MGYGGFHWYPILGERMRQREAPLPHFGDTVRSESLHALPHFGVDILYVAMG